MARFWSYVDKEPAGCWIWAGAKRDRYGYGCFNVDGKIHKVHRWAYEQFVGPIPDGLAIDHVWAKGCRSKSCVNPAHLEPVTTAENNRRAAAVRPVVTCMVTDCESRSVCRGMCKSHYNRWHKASRRR